MHPLLAAAVLVVGVAAVKALTDADPDLNVEWFAYLDSRAEPHV